LPPIAPFSGRNIEILIGLAQAVQLAAVARPADIIIFFDAFAMWHGTSKGLNNGPIPENWNVAFVDGHAKNIPHTVFMDQHPSRPAAAGRLTRLNQDPAAENPNL
jgi:hypothetical protein